MTKNLISELRSKTQRNIFHFILFCWKQFLVFIIHNDALKRPSSIALFVTKRTTDTFFFKLILFFRSFCYVKCCILYTLTTLNTHHWKRKLSLFISRITSRGMKGSKKPERPLYHFMMWMKYTVLYVCNKKMEILIGICHRDRKKKYNKMLFSCFVAQMDFIFINRFNCMMCEYREREGEQPRKGLSILWFIWWSFALRTHNNSMPQMHNPGRVFRIVADSFELTDSMSKRWVFICKIQLKSETTKTKICVNSSPFAFYRSTVIVQNGIKQK